MYADTTAYKHNRKSVLSVIISDSTAVPTMWSTEKKTVTFIYMKWDF
jgi:hypothetical protein